MATTDNQLSQRDLVPVVRGLVDDLQAAVAVGEWGRAARRLHAVLEANPLGMEATYVRHNLGERTAFLERFAEARGLPWPA